MPARVSAVAGGADGGAAPRRSSRGLGLCARAGAYDKERWADWELLDGRIRSAPAAVSWDSGRIDVFARGADVYGLYHKPYENGWGNWEELGSKFTSAPGVSSWAPGRLDVFMRHQNNTLRHRTFQA